MSAKAISEFDAKRIVSEHLLEKHAMRVCTRMCPVSIPDGGPAPTADDLRQKHPWLLSLPSPSSLVVKPDQLIKRRGKLGLVKVGVTLEEALEWCVARSSEVTEVGKTSGRLSTFIVEPLCAHKDADEHYVCLMGSEDGTDVLFCEDGGVDVGDVDAKAARTTVPVGEKLSVDAARGLVAKVGAEGSARREKMAAFVSALFDAYDELHFTYLEINPVVFVEEGDGELSVLDMAARLDQTAEFLCHQAWGDVSFPAPFGRGSTPEEAYIASLDAKTGASLKLTVLNPEGRVWTMVAGGGASVVYSDTVADLGFAHELANYGEYSGAPSESQTFEYAKTVIDLMTRTKRDEGKVLLVGGGIANFTNVAATFKGIVRAFREFRERLLEFDVSIYVRRGGPNYQEGLRNVAQVGEELGLPVQVYGPETHITSIVPIALGLKPAAKQYGQSVADREDYTQAAVLQSGGSGAASPAPSAPSAQSAPSEAASKLAEQQGAKTTIELDNESGAPSGGGRGKYVLYDENTSAIVFGMQPRAVQSMMDYDHCCGRKRPSVVAMVYPFGDNHFQKFYWGADEVLVPVYTSMNDAMLKHPRVDTVVNFSSFRSVLESTLDVMSHEGVRTVAIIAEGVPERHAKLIRRQSVRRGVSIIGPATVGGIRAGAFKVGNTGGMLDNIIGSKLYRPGSVAYVSKSGGMSNELNNILARNSDGTYEGVAIGGDRYPGSTFLDHLLRYQENPSIKMLVLLGEVGGTEEYKVCEAIKDGRITKPVVAWCIGTCAKMFDTEVQFGHAGALAHSDLETADAKNRALREAGARVPPTFDDLPDEVRKTYDSLVSAGTIVPRKEPRVPQIPIDFKWAQELGLVRKPSTFISTISDERGQELLYAGVPISDVLKQDLGIGGVISLLWCKRSLPRWATKYIETLIVIMSDHGPAVSGAHNTIVTARAGKDLVSSLVSGLLTIGERFGGALDGAAKQFGEAFAKGLSPREFVDGMRRQKKLILGIGHRIKSIDNPDARCTLLKEYVKEHFPGGASPLLDYALEVEKITTAKRGNLILNVDGVTAVTMIDLLHATKAFTASEVDDLIGNGMLNGLFVIARSIGFCGHFLDQKRLKQGLYRTDHADIFYSTAQAHPNDDM